LKFINCQKNKQKKQTTKNKQQNKKLKILIVKQVNMFTGLILLLVNIKLGLLLGNVLNFFQEGKLKILELLKRDQAKPVI